MLVNIGFHGLVICTLWGMPVEQDVEFDLEQIRKAIVLLTSHRARWRIIINFEKGQA